MNPLSQYLMIAKLLALLGAVGIICAQSSMIHRARENVRHCTAAREVDQRAYQAAQDEAAAENKLQVQKIEQQSKRISDDERQAYLSDLAKLRAYNERLRSPQAAPRRPASPASPPKAPAPASGADGNGLQVPSLNDLHDEASVIELRLMHLQNYVREQLGLDPNAGAPAK